jgi:hypothetical protein
MPLGWNVTEIVQQSAQRTKPWAWSTGPRTAAGKARSKLNAWKHGERSAEAIRWQQENTELMRRMKALSLLRVMQDC